MSTDTRTYMADTIERNGEQVTLSYSSGGAIGNSGRPAAGATTVSFIVNAIVRGMAKSLVDGEAVQQGDRMALVDATDLTTAPEIGWSMVRDNDTDLTYSVLGVTPRECAGEVIAYDLHVRGG